MATLMQHKPHIKVIQYKSTKLCSIRICRKDSYYTVESNICLSGALEASDLLAMLTDMRVYCYEQDHNFKLKAKAIFDQLEIKNATTN